MEYFHRFFYTDSLIEWQNIILTEGVCFLIANHQTYHLLVQICIHSSGDECTESTEHPQNLIKYFTVKSVYGKWSGILLYLRAQSTPYNMSHSYKHFFWLLLGFLYNFQTLINTSRFSILPKDTFAYRLEQPGIWPPTFQLVDEVVENVHYWHCITQKTK